MDSQPQHEAGMDILVVGGGAGRPSTANGSLETDTHGGKSKTGVGWEELSWIMLADVVGSSVLCFAGVAATIGWITCFFIVCSCVISIYSAVLMNKTFCILSERKKGPATLGEAARLIFDSDRAAFWIYILVYGIFGFLGNSSYLLVLGSCIVDIADHPAILDRRICSMTASAVACVMITPLVLIYRRMTGSPRIWYTNFCLIVAALIICLVEIAKNGKVVGGQTHLVQPNLTLLPFFGSMGNICYAFTGHWMYFEMMVEMERPETFPKVFYINAPIQLGLYLVVTITGYYYLGDTATGYLPDNIPRKSTERAIVSLLLFCHIAISYLIKSINLSRYVCSVVAPSIMPMQQHDQAGPHSTASPDESMAGRALYYVSAVLLLISGWGVVNAIPVFDELVGLIGALLSAPISFIIPIIFYVLAVRLQKKGMEPLLSDSLTPHQNSPKDCRHWCYAALGSYRSLSTQQKCSILTVSTIAISVMVLGTVDEVKRIFSDSSISFGC